MLQCLRLFRENADVLKTYQERFRYMLVDEYQDTNTVEYLWLRLLAQGRHNFCCVATTISRSMAGAAPRSIISCVSRRIFRARRSSGSTAIIARPGHILATAANLIAHNEGRLGKTLFTDDVEGEQPTVTGVWDLEEEARGIGEEIERLQRKDMSSDEVAILRACLVSDARIRRAFHHAWPAL